MQTYFERTYEGKGLAAEFFPPPGWMPLAVQIPASEGHPMRWGSLHPVFRILFIFYPNLLNINHPRFQSRFPFDPLPVLALPKQLLPLLLPLNLLVPQTKD